MKTASQVLEREQHPAWWMETALVVGASLFVALCARVTVPLPFTPVPLTLQNFAVLLVGLTLGSRRGFAALALYLGEGAIGLPVFNPAGLGGIAQLLGPTGGYLMAYPFVAFVSGWIAERGVQAAFVAEPRRQRRRSFAFRLRPGLAEVWTRGSWWQAAHFGLYPFVFAEVAKVMAAAALAMRWPARTDFRFKRGLSAPPRAPHGQPLPRKAHSPMTTAVSIHRARDQRRPQPRLRRRLHVLRAGHQQGARQRAQVQRTRCATSRP